MEKQEGFTLLELIVTILIISVLITVGVLFYLDYMQDTYVARLKPTLTSIHKKMITNYHKYNRMCLEADDGNRFSIAYGSIEKRVGINIPESIENNWRFHTQGYIYYYMNDTGEYRLDGHLLAVHRTKDITVDMEFSDDTGDDPFRIYIKD